jgi:hypothetical protein
MRQRGRPSKYTPELGQKLCALLAIGVPISVACRSEGVGKTTLHTWRAQGAAGVDPFAAFVAELERALAKAEAAITMHVVKAAQQDWRAGAWWLERRHPERYGAKQTVRVDQPAVAEMTEAELDAAVARHGYVRGGIER